MEKVDNSLVNLVVDMSHRIYLAQSKCKDYEVEIQRLKNNYEDLWSEHLRLKEKLAK